MNGIRLGLLMSLVCKVSWRGMSAARRICLLTKLRFYGCNLVQGGKWQIVMSSASMKCSVGRTDTS